MRDNVTFETKLRALS